MLSRQDVGRGTGSCGQLKLLLMMAQGGLAAVAAQGHTGGAAKHNGNASTCTTPCRRGASWAPVLLFSGCAI